MALSRFQHNAEQYMISINDHIKIIGPAVEQLCIDECEKNVKFMYTFVTRHLIDDDNPERSIKGSILHDVVRDLLRSWMKRDGSTIHVFRNALKHEKRDDLVKQLDSFRRDKTLLSIIVHRHGSVDLGLTEELSKRCLGLKPLVEHVRPIISRKLRYENGKYDVIRLKTALRNVNWSTPAKHFKGTTVDIVIENLSMDQSERKTAPPRLERCQHVEECSGRKVRSWIENDSVFFENEPEGVSDASADSVDTLSTAMAGGLLVGRSDLPALRRAQERQDAEPTIAAIQEEGKLNLLESATSNLRPRELKVTSVSNAELPTTSFAVAESESDA